MKEKGCRWRKVTIRSNRGAEILERWQGWQACVQVRQSFCTPGHTNCCATSVAVALVPGCDRSWTDWNTCSRKGAGTCGRDPPVDGDRCAGNW
jgi:hypothetical protein